MSYDASSEFTYTSLLAPGISTAALLLQYSKQESKHTRVLDVEDVILTWCSCKHNGEQVDAHSDAIEDRKSSEAIGDWVHLRRSACEKCVCVFMNATSSRRIFWSSTESETMPTGGRK